MDTLSLPSMFLVISGIYCSYCTSLYEECVYKDDISEEFDFVIVGAGSGGAVVANRLSEIANWTVLLLEAGEEETLVSQIPYFAPTVQKTPIDWQYKLEPQTKACLATKNQQCLYARGKVLGGSSALNYLIYFRGNHRDYDNWETLGNPGWGYDDVLPYFLKSEGNKNVGGPFHNNCGPLSVENIPYYTPLTNSFIEAASLLNYSYVDLNTNTESGFTHTQSTTNHGSRCSTNKAFLKVCSRPNLHIRTASVVTKILIEPRCKVAYGVNYRYRGLEYTVRAKKEVIVSGGSINTPQLLMLSGIGSKEHLQEMGIPVVKDLPGVGRNLQDHVAYGGLWFIVNDTVTLRIDRVLSNANNYLQYIVGGIGPLSSTGCEAFGVVYTPFAIPKIDRPDVEILLTSLSFVGDGGMYLRNVLGLKEEIVEYYNSLIGTDAFILFPLVLRPKSRGRIKLNSPDPLDKPLIYANYLNDRRDVVVAIEGIKLAVQLAESEPFNKYGTQMYEKPFPGCENYVFRSDEYWECAVRHFTLTIYHFSGSCKMGPPSDTLAVVDHELKVYGINHLRVVDASVMPEIIGGHTNAPTIMIGEKVADMIKYDYLKSNNCNGDLN